MLLPTAKKSHLQALCANRKASQTASQLLHDITAGFTPLQLVVSHSYNFKSSRRKLVSDISLFSVDREYYTSLHSSLMKDKTGIFTLFPSF